jgi:hypothetical protein
MPGWVFPDLDFPDHTGAGGGCRSSRSTIPWRWFSSRGARRSSATCASSANSRTSSTSPTRLVVLSVDPPEVQAAFRAGLGAHFAFLSDAEGHWLPRLGLLERTDAKHRPYRPAAFQLVPRSQDPHAYNGYRYWGRATMEELRRDMREITRAVRPDWDAPAA